MEAIVKDLIKYIKALLSRRTFRIIIGGVYEGAANLTPASYTDILTVTHGYGRDLRVGAISLRYKAGLETAKVKVKDNRGFEIVSGVQICQIGKPQTTSTDRDELPVEFPLQNSGSVTVQIISSVAVNPGDISISLFANPA